MTKYVKRCLNSTHCQVDKYTKSKREEIKDDDRSEPWTSLSKCVSQTKDRDLVYMVTTFNEPAIKEIHTGT